MDYTSLPDSVTLQRTIEAVRSRGINVTLVETKESALSQIEVLIPAGATVMTGASVTLQQIGLETFLKENKHSWRNLKDELLAESDLVKRAVLRKQATLADYFLGSVHAILETGEILIASATGSQLPAYAYSSSNVIWVAGAQKITPTLEDALHRIRDYANPHEDQRLKQTLGPQAASFVGKILIFEREAPYLRRSINLILVNRVLGV